MAVRITREYVCDVCGQDGTVSRYHIQRTTDGKKVSPDLCEEHAESLEAMFKLLPAGKRGQVRARRVLTEDQIKQKRRTPAKKSTTKARKRP